MPATTPHTAACCSPSPRKGEPGRDAEPDAGDDLHQQVAFDLRADLVERLDRDALFGEARSGDAH
jgi:hypothetical protein